MAQKKEQTDNHNTDTDLIPTNRWGEDIPIDGELVKSNLVDIKNKIAPYTPLIIGVTKYYGLNSIIKGYEAGLRDFGESRAIESIAKINSLPQEIKQNSRFHFIGHLQSNKVDKVVEVFDFIHSVDSRKLAESISKASALIGKTQNVLLQVNNAGEEQKFGYTKEQLKKDFPELLKLESIKIVGLMNMLPLGASENEQRILFRDLHSFRAELEKEFEVKLPELSMGMSDDHENAAKEGATMIRIGRKIFK